MSRLIDADALIRDIEHYHVSDGKFQHWVEVQPTIEPPTGKWEDTAVFYIGDNLGDSKVIDSWQSARCSNCGKYHTTPYMYYFTKYEICPHCGARMEGEG